MSRKVARPPHAANLSDESPQLDKYESTEVLIPNSTRASEKFSDDEIKPYKTRTQEVTSKNDHLPPRQADRVIERHQQAGYMIFCAFLGVLLALGHHIFHLKLDHTFAGSETRQQWAHAFGNSLAISVAASFAFASRVAYKQYFWTVCITLNSFYSVSLSVSPIRANLEFFVSMFLRVELL
jgi:hypothetical protein